MISRLTFTFDQVELKGIMELNGAIDFPEGKAIVIYGSNQQGKTNVINAIRYAFLRDAKGLGRPKKEYDDRLLPTREELIFGDQAEVIVKFHHNGLPYTLRRSILSKGKREESELLRTDKPGQPEDVEGFLRTRLKVSLLDALFAPDITQGFKQLYSGDIDESVAQMFKEITTLREMTVGFIQRLERLRLAAEAQCSLIEDEYKRFRGQISKSSPSVASLPEFKKLGSFVPGTTFQKLEDLHSRVNGIITKLKEKGFASELGEAVEKAKQLDRIKKKLRERESIQQEIARLKNVQSDHRALKKWATSMNSVTMVEDSISSVPKLRDETVQSKVERALSTFAEAKSAKSRAVDLSKEEGVRIESLPVALQDLRKLASLLSKDIRIGKELSASVTKVNGKVYTILPFKLLSSDSSFTDINRQPIPQGDRTQKKNYLDSLRQKIRRLERVRTLDDESAKLFDEFVQIGRRGLNRLVGSLDDKADEIDERLRRWSQDLAAVSISFTGTKIIPRELKSTPSLNNYARQIESLASKAEKRHLTKVKRALHQVNVEVAGFDQPSLEQASKEVNEKLSELPQTQSIEVTLSQTKLFWQKQDEAYQDYFQVPKITEASTTLLKEILSKCFDESKLREQITGTYNEILNLMHERRMVQAVAEVPTGSLKAVVKYKGKQISHPAGSEKAFYSLAILTALAHYFQVPVLIDEVANNLDSKNLRAFFEMVREFKDRYSVQYVLSIKQTNDFDFDGWVKDLRDDIAIHEIKDKNIVKISI